MINSKMLIGLYCFLLFLLCLTGAECNKPNSNKTDSILAELHDLGGNKTDQATEILRSYLSHQNPRVRAKAGEYLTWPGRWSTRSYPERSKDILRLLTDSSPRVRGVGMVGLRGANDAGLIPRLIELLEDNNPEIRLAVAKAFWIDEPCGCPGCMGLSRIGGLKDPQTVEPLARRMTTDPDERVRAAAGMALSFYRDPKTSEALIAALGDVAKLGHYHTISTYAADALVRMKIQARTEKVRDAILTCYPTNSAWIYPLARHHVKQAEIKHLIQMEIPRLLKSQNETEIIGALCALRIYPMPLTEERLIKQRLQELTIHTRPRVRKAAEGLESDLNELRSARETNVDTRDEKGATVLHRAAISNLPARRDLVEVLIANGADVNSKAKDGTTPLHWAAARGNRDIADLLITKGANIDTHDNQGKTPLDLALEHRKKDFVEWLRGHGRME